MHLSRIRESKFNNRMGAFFSIFDRPQITLIPTGDKIKYLTSLDQNGTEEFRIYEEDETPATALITFASYVNAGRDSPSFAYLNSALRVRQKFNLKCDIYFLLSKENDWYFSGIAGIDGDNMFKSARRLKLLLNRQKYRKTVFLGNSMGGYAALAFGALCKPDKVVAFSPQTRFDKNFHDSIKENRWRTEFDKMRAGYDIDRHQVATLIRKRNRKTHYTIYAGSKCTQDVLFAKEAASIYGVEFFEIDSSGHDLVMDFRSSGRLEEILRSAMSCWSD